LALAGAACAAARRAAGYPAYVPKKPSPDDNLSPLNFRSLNATFYAAEPADYFNRRLHNLILVAGNREGLDQLLSEGVRFGSLTVGGQPPKADSEATGTPDGEAASGQPTSRRGRDADDGAAKREQEAARSAAHFVSAEAELLAHHAGETLLRLYLAHEFAAGGPAPSCPPLDLARLRSFTEFKERVRLRFGERSDAEDREHRNAVARVFHATDVRENLLPAPPPVDLWEKSLANIEGYLRAFAHQHLERAPLYNAAKHGLALTPTEMSVQMDDGSLLKAEGQVIQYLEVRDDRHDRPRWQQVTHWVKADRQMALVFRTCQLIEALWETARYRYLASRRGTGYNLNLFAGASYSELLFSGEQPKSGIVVEDMRVELLYETSDEDDAPESDQPSNDGILGVDDQGEGDDELDV